MEKNQEMIARLIDGELSDHERSDFLTFLDHGGSEDWRSLALGFVERQMITEALWKMEGKTAKVVSLPEKKRNGVGGWMSCAAMLIFGLFVGIVGPDLSGKKSGEVVSGDSQKILSSEEDLRELVPLVHTANTSGHSSMRLGYISADFRDGSQLIVPVNYILDQDR